MSNTKTVRCSVCGKEFELSRSTYYNRLKIDPNNPKFYCEEHKNLGRQEDLKNFADKMTPEQKAEKHEKLSAKTKAQWASYDENKRKEISEIFSKAQKKRLESMTPEEAAIEFEKRSERTKKVFAEMSEEDREKFRQKASKRSKEMWANMSDERRDEVKKKQSIGLKKHIDSLSPEEFDQWYGHLVDGYAAYNAKRKAGSVNDKMKDAYLHGIV